MALLDTTALQAVLKQKYTQRRFNLLCYKKNPFYALIPKITDFGGKNKVIALRNGVPQGRGTNIAAAQANKTATIYTAFTVTRNSDYATASITGEAVKAAKGDENTLIEGLTKEIDGTIHVCMRSLAIAMFRNGGGQRGQIASGQTGATVTLSTLTDITNFEPNMILRVSSDDGSPAAPAGLRAGQVTVTGVDRDLGTITVTPNWNVGIGAVAANDFIFQGNASGSDYGGMIKGLAGWVPATAPTSTDNFFGVPRNSDATRLAGIRFNGSGGPIEESFIEAAARVVREGGSPDHTFMNPLDWSNLVKALGSKVLYERSAPLDEPDIGFKAVMLDGPEGPIKILADLNCPKGTAYMLQLDTWHLESLGEAPMILDFDGNTILRSATSDDYEVRVGYYAQMTCEAPGWNAVITL
jgi:hypothetical protein